VAVSAILLTYANCFVLIDSVKNINIATNAAQGVIEEIRNTPFKQLTDPAYCDCFNSLCNGCTFTVTGITGSLGTVTINETVPELLEVTISVSWQQKARPMTIQVTTRVVNRSY
jgi:hypothetical protein